MNPIIEEKKRLIYQTVRDAALRLYGVCPDFSVIRPKDSRNGDFSAAAALALGGILRRPPIITAAEIAAELVLPQGERAVAMGKGYINFFLRPDFLRSVLEPPRELPPLPMPDMSGADFGRFYCYNRMRAVLNNQGTPPSPGVTAELSLLTTPPEVRLLWAAAAEETDELMASAADFYDKIGLKSGYPPLSAARYVLLNNALYILYANLRKELS